jgi:hypothetical protein
MANLLCNNVMGCFRTIALALIPSENEKGPVAGNVFPSAGPFGHLSFPQAPLDTVTRVRYGVPDYPLLRLPLPLKLAHIAYWRQYMRLAPLSLLLSTFSAAY